MDKSKHIKRTCKELEPNKGVTQGQNCQQNKNSREYQILPNQLP